MCTLGDPLMDLGYVLALWPEAGDPPMWRAGGMPTWRAGFPTRAEATERYARKTGFDVAMVHWYYVFSIFRFAAILQQIYARFERGQTHDERFAGFGAQANALVAAAGSLAR
jgi:aminoglycoside phosphotransferase (APT) family kinase protein